MENVYGIYFVNKIETGKDINIVRLNLLVPSGPVQACSGIAFIFTFYLFFFQPKNRISILGRNKTQLPTASRPAVGPSLPPVQKEP